MSMPSRKRVAIIASANSGGTMVTAMLWMHGEFEWIPMDIADIGRLERFSPTILRRVQLSDDADLGACVDWQINIGR